MNKLELHAEIDLDPIIKTVENSKLEADSSLFSKLSQIGTVKQQLKELQDQFDNAEKLVKQTINDRAKAILGADWQAIAGKGYKITRSATGTVYSLGDIEQIDEAFLIVKITPNTEAIEKFLLDKAKLPDGVDYAPDRGESIRITVDN